MFRLRNNKLAQYPRPRKKQGLPYRWTSLPKAAAEECWGRCVESIFLHPSHEPLAFSRSWHYQWLCTGVRVRVPSVKAGVEGERSKLEGKGDGQGQGFLGSGTQRSPVQAAVWIAARCSVPLVTISLTSGSASLAGPKQRLLNLGPEPPAYSQMCFRCVGTPWQCLWCTLYACACGIYVHIHVCMYIYMCACA